MGVKKKLTGWQKLKWKNRPRIKALGKKEDLPIVYDPREKCMKSGSSKSLSSQQMRANSFMKRRHDD